MPGDARDGILLPLAVSWGGRLQELHGSLGEVTCSGTVWQLPRLRDSSSKEEL